MKKNKLKKQNIITGIIVLAGLSAVGLIYYFTKPNKSKNTFTKDNSTKDNSTKDDGKVKSILFIGDSNTVASWSYADQLRKQFPNLKIKKIAKVGKKTDWMKKQLSDELKSGNKYDLVAILGGSNDIYALGKNDSAKINLNEMYKMIRNSGSKVLAITPPNKDFYTKKTDQKQKSLFDLVDWIKGNNNADYKIDFHKITADRKYFSSSDGYLHANASAHKILQQQTSNKINIV